MISSDRRLALLAVFTATIALLGCQPQASHQATIDDLQASALESDLAWSLLSSLTTEVGPRMAGTAGDAKAVQWAEGKMMELGFDRAWLEPVRFPLWRRGLESASIVAPRRQTLAVAAIGGSPGTSGVLNAQVVHYATLDALRDADEAEVQGRIVFISQRMERTRNGAGYAAAVGGRTQGPFVAAAKGAAALVIRSIGTSNNRLAHTGTMSSSTPGPAVPSAALSNPDADLLLEMLAVNERVVMELRLDVGVSGEAESFNVIGEIDGREDSGEFVLIGGHLDSWDLGTGAVDNGSGVAMSLAAATLVARLPERPRRGIRVVLFANEEQGIHGGSAYIAQHHEELERHAIGVESDLGAGRIYQFRSRVSEPAEPAMDELARYLQPLGIPRQLDRPATGGADLGQLVRAGMPVVDMSLDASNYFDWHHSANDTLDKVKPQDLQFNVAAYATFLYFAAESDIDF